MEYTIMDNFTKGMIVPMDGGGDPVTFQWNPATIKHSRDSDWKSMYAAGNESPHLQYTCGKAHVFSFSIDVSRWNNSDFFVKGFADKLMALAATCSAGGAVKRPPKIMFTSGQAHKVRGVIDKVEITYTTLANPNSLLHYGATIKITILRLN